MSTSRWTTHALCTHFLYKTSLQTESKQETTTTELSRHHSTDTIHCYITKMQQENLLSPELIKDTKCGDPSICAEIMTPRWTPLVTRVSHGTVWMQCFENSWLNNKYWYSFSQASMWKYLHSQLKTEIHNTSQQFVYNMQ